MKEHLKRKQRLRLEALNQAVALHAAGYESARQDIGGLPAGAILDTAKTFEAYLEKGWA